MNIDQLYTLEDHERGAEMQVKGPTGKLLDMHITVKGVDSKTFRKGFNQSKREIMMGNDTTLAEAKLMSDIIIGWRGFEDKGKELKFTKEKAEQLFLNAPYLKDQVDVFIAKRKNFMKA